MDYFRGPYPNAGISPQQQALMAPPSHTMQAPTRYFGGPLGSQSNSMGASQRSNDRSQNSMDRTKRKGKNLRKQGTYSQGSMESSSQNYMQSMMSQESYTAFDDFGMSQDSQSQTQNTQDL